MQTLCRRLANDANKGRAIHIGVGNAGYQVRCTRPQRAKADTRFPREASVRICCKRGRLLVTVEHKLDRAVDQRNHYIGVFSPGTPKILVTPSASRQHTNKSDAFTSFLSNHGCWVELSETTMHALRHTFVPNHG